MAFIQVISHTCRGLSLLLLGHFPTGGELITDPNYLIGQIAKIFLENSPSLLWNILENEKIESDSVLRTEILVLVCESGVVE